MGGSASKPLLNVRAKSADGKLEAVLVGGREVRVFEQQQRRQCNLVQVIESLGSENCSFTGGSDISADGKFTAGYDGLSNTITIIELATGTIVKKLGKEQKFEFGCQVLFSKDGKYVYFCNHGVTGVCAGHNEIFVYEIESEKLVNKLQGHSAVVTSMAMSPCGKYLATGDHSATMIVWDLTTSPTDPKKIGNPKFGRKCTDKHQVTSIAFSGDSKYVYGVHDDQQDAMLDPKVFGYKVADPEHEQVCALGMFDEQKVYAISRSGCGKMMIGYMEEKFIRVFMIDEATGNLKKKFDVGGFSSNTEFGSCSPSNILACYDRDNLLYLLDLNDDGRKILAGSKSGAIESISHQYAPVWSPDGSLLINPNQTCGNLRCFAVVMGEEKGSARKVKTGDEKLVYTSMSFSADGNQVNLVGGEKNDEKETIAV